MKRLWWISEGGQGSIMVAEADEITDAVKAAAIKFLGGCTDEDQEDGIRRGRWKVEEI